MPSATVLVFSASLLLFSLSVSAHPVCRSCMKNCYPKEENVTVSRNGTDDGDLLFELESTRFKRSAGEVEFRACSRFQIEMLLIPLSIAMIPLVLSALILCTCCCGPKDSRGKLPEDFLSNFPMSKKRRISSEEIEMNFRDGYVQRKDSSKTKFSTVVSYIEARRESMWSMRSAGGNSIVEPTAEPTDTPTATEVPSTASPAGTTDRPSTLGDLSTEDLYLPSAPQPVVIPTLDRLKKVASTESMKRLRFSDTVSVISVESLSRR